MPAPHREPLPPLEARKKIFEMLERRCQPFGSLDTVGFFLTVHDLEICGTDEFRIRLENLTEDETRIVSNYFTHGIDIPALATSGSKEENIRNLGAQMPTIWVIGHCRSFLSTAHKVFENVRTSSKPLATSGSKEENIRHTPNRTSPALLHRKLGKFLPRSIRLENTRNGWAPNQSGNFDGSGKRNHVKLFE
ncbi:hypothetical protein PRIPAC_71139 [Pristionchus pacificus]|uniref:Uncharacterized protein n=1 Tax=Pristionchus pacificus TaxID=54126 RepID=A0A2A6C1A4_PRIPA|nr:hypothetical protein PRIPAC_71139 [Pristionchus pacificus]|eukprot:PDM71896.1 hypothetical protein PRIPAC_38303 [Pristionchus pacificus]